MVKCEHWSQCVNVSNDLEPASMFEAVFSSRKSLDFDTVAHFVVI